MFYGQLEIILKKMKNKLYILVGISGSGKSTLAHQMWAKNPLKTIIVNRDKIREELFGYNESTIKEYYQRKDIRSLEKQVTIYQDVLIYSGFSQGKDVIIDATNLNKKDIESFSIWNKEVVVIPAINSFDVELCIKRDAERTRSVGEDVIKKQYNKFKSIIKEEDINLDSIDLNNNPSNKPVYVFDIDNTLAHKGDRNPFDESKVLEDVPDTTICNLAQILHNSGTEILICSGRTKACLEDTKEWLRINLGFVPEIRMREIGDQRADWIIKTEMWQDICKKKYIIGMFDDRAQVCYRAKMLGLKVLQVENGLF